MLVNLSYPVIVLDLKHLGKIVTQGDTEPDLSCEPGTSAYAKKIGNGYFVYNRVGPNVSGHTIAWDIEVADLAELARYCAECNPNLKYLFVVTSLPDARHLQ